MFWKRKSEASAPSRADVARAASLDQVRPVPILKAAMTPTPAPQPLPEILVGSTGSIRFAGGSDGGSPASSAGSRSISPHRSPVSLPTQQMAGQPLYQPQPARQPHLPAINTDARSPQARSSYGFNHGQAPVQSPSRTGSQPHPHPPSPTHPGMQRVQTQSSRRSSRPASPSTTSFGARLPYGSIIMPVAQPSPRRPSQPLTTPPLGSASHITTPPTAYCSAGQSRAAPPPSPYRRPNERRPLELLPTSANSLFDTPSAPTRLHSGHTPKAGVPMLNIIPATPQAMGEEWSAQQSQAPRRDPSKELDGAFGESQTAFPPTASVSAPMITVSEPTQGVKRQGSLPALDELQFSPFEGRMVLPKSASIESLPKRSPPTCLATLPHGTPDTIRLASPPVSAPVSLPTTSPDAPPCEPLPSPPFESYSSLPSLDSEQSMPSSASCSSLRSSSSSSSLNSYPDVEEALGSMLASLSDPSMPLPSIDSFSKRSSAASAQRHHEASNAGLGLGLAMDTNNSSISLTSSTSATAPLSPRRKAPPAPLDLSFTFPDKNSFAPVQHSAPPRINHRVAFYSSAKAAPNSPHSGVFTQIPHSASGNVEGSTEFVSSPNPGAYSSGYPGGPTRTWSQTSLSTEETELSYARGMRDSISLTSEASDEDLHTASIVCLTPVMPREYDYAEERVQGYVAEVGVAL